MEQETHGDSVRADGAKPAIGELFAGRYEIEALLGRGGMGSVYRAHDREVGEVVALKTLDTCADDAKAVDRFRREVRLARRVTHRNTARTYDLGEHQGLRFLTMEYVDGHSMRTWQSSRPRPTAVVEVALQIAAGLQAAHEAGVIHRDLKPSNIMIEAGGRVVITDFGIARLSAEHGKELTGGLLGTPAYMAPEQVEGKPVDARTDVYSLGLILVEMLAGKLPFHGDNPFALAMARLRVELPDLRASGRIPEPLLDPLGRALCRDAAGRFASAAAFAGALEDVLEHLEDQTFGPGQLDDWGDDADPDSHSWATQTSASLFAEGIAGEAAMAGRAPSSGGAAMGPSRIRQTTSTEGLALTHGHTLLSELTDRTGLRLPVSTSTPGPRGGAKALAVLPFRYRGPADSDFIADALLDELTDVLSMTRGLKVTSSGAAARLASSGDRDPRSFGTALGVDVVVDGTIQLAGKRLRIAARLLDVDGGFQLWSERFEGQLEDVFELQDKMARRIAEALRVELQILEHRELADIDAIESYLRAREAKTKWRLRGPDGAVAYYRAVLARAPAFKPAIAGLAIACMRAWFMPADEDESAMLDWAADAKIAVEVAMAEAPEFAETRIAAASWAVQGGFYREAAEHLREALRIAPTCALAHEYLGRLQVEAAHPERGIAHLELALELDPGLDWCLADIARHKALQGDYDGYRSLMDQLLVRTERHRASAQLMLMRVGAWRRDLVEVRTALQEIDLESSDEGARMISTYGPPLLGPYEPEALKQQHAMALGALQNGRMRTLVYQLFAEQVAFHGDMEQALVYLSEAAQLVLVDLDWLDNCPLLDGLREDPRFLQVRTKVRARCQEIWAAG